MKAQWKMIVWYIYIYIYEKTTRLLLWDYMILYKYFVVVFLFYICDDTCMNISFIWCGKIIIVSWLLGMKNLCIHLLGTVFVVVGYVWVLSVWCICRRMIFGCFLAFIFATVFCAGLKLCRDFCCLFLFKRSAVDLNLLAGTLCYFSVSICPLGRSRKKLWNHQILKSSVCLCFFIMFLLLL